MKKIRLIGNTFENGFKVNIRSKYGSQSNDDAWNTAVQCLRNRGKMLASFDYLFLDSDTNGYLDKNRIL